MTRLYYERLLVHDPATAKAVYAEVPKLGAAGEYLDKVAKLVPSEVIAAFVAIMGVVPSVRNPSWQPGVGWGAFLICLIMTPIYLNYQAVPNAPKKIHLVLSTLAFVAWAYAVSGASLVPSLYDPAIASIELIVFSVVSGAIPLRT
jgi:hypothetical protein